MIYPALLIYFDADWRVLEMVEVTGDGVLKLPQYDGRVGVQTRFADGSIDVLPPPPPHVRTDEDLLQWRNSRCGARDPLSGIGRCCKDRDHEDGCELTYLNFEGGPHAVTMTFAPTDFDRLVRDTRLISDTSLGIWTIYHNVTDFPEHEYVARLHLAFAGRSILTSRVIVGETLDEVREELPQGLVCLARSASDDPNIVESWA